MHILPVLDLMAGRVVRGISGNRSDYRPIISQLTPSCEPVAIANTFAKQFGLTELYLADLDAIAGAAPALAVYNELQTRGFRLWIDAGVQDIHRTRVLADAGVEKIVIGLETVAGPAELTAAVKMLGERIVFSLDLRDGKPYGNLATWLATDAEGIAAEAIALGISRLMVLDLVSVGCGAGTKTEELCGQLVTAYPHVAVYAGGGVRDVSDLRRLQAIGVRGALVASALHDGSLKREDLSGL